MGEEEEISFLLLTLSERLTKATGIKKRSGSQKASSGRKLFVKLVIGVAKVLDSNRRSY